MNVKCRYEIPKEVYEHSNGDIGNYVGNMIVNELCKKIADIVANGGEYIFRMTPEKFMENPYTNSIHYQRCVLYEPLIRCKDCIHYESDGGAMMICNVTDMVCDNDDYCSYGERREDGEA